MKNHEETVGILVGKCDANTHEICRSLAKEGISAIVKQKEGPVEADDAPRQWSGQPGKDLFFNGWKLLF
jgi:hypothetical protein